MFSGVELKAKAPLVKPHELGDLKGMKMIMAPLISLRETK